MRHEDGQRHARHDPVRDPAGQHLAEPRASIGAHDEQIGAEFGGFGKQQLVNFASRLGLCILKTSSIKLPARMS
jgi:hypothetical protein